MSLSAGTRLGPYEIVAPLGAGGMGEVWRARDTKLDRDVAIKVLPESVASDSHALSRFETEAKAVAALSHPNILAIHDFGRISGVSFAVMELLEGESLRSALAHGPLPVRRTLDIAVEIAEGLAAAHEKGIVHRDLKPENVFLTKDDHVKILDFGLARQSRLQDVEDTHSPTVEKLTDPGSIVGTVAYMSPEQAKGQPVDFRSDQFSFGVLLYEMLAGARPFKGTSAPETLTAIIREEPEPLEKLAPRTPAPARWIVERLLAKEPAGRYAATRDLARELATCRQHLSDFSSREAVELTDSGAASRASTRIVLRRALAAGAALALLAAGALLDRSFVRKPAGRPTLNLVRLTWEPGVQIFPSISPDGASFAYAAGPIDNKTDIFVRRIGGENPVNLTKGFPGPNTTPAFSPDGQSIAFRSGQEGIFVMGATGESMRRLTDFGFDPAWSPDGKSIAFSTRGVRMTEGRGEVWILDMASGARRKVFDGPALRPSWSPTGSRLAFERIGRAVSTIPVSGGIPTDVVALSGTAPADPAWALGGIWFQSNAGGGNINVWRVPVDEATGQAAGAPEQVITSTTVSWWPSSSVDGRRVVFASGGISFALVRYGFDPQKGRLLPEPVAIPSGPREIRAPIPSPDGEWLATHLFDQGLHKLLLVRASTGETRRLTDDSLTESDFAWAPDGSKIYFCVAPAEKTEVWAVRPDGSGRELVVSGPEKEDVVSPYPFPDGRRMYVEVGKHCTSSIVDLSVPPAERRPAPLPPMAENRRFRAWDVSPDGRWLVGYPVDEALKVEPSVTLFDVERKTYRKLVDLEGKHECAWLPDSHRILLCSKAGELRLLDRETGALTPAGSVGEGFETTALSRDGRWIMCGKNTIENHIWMLDYGPSRK